MKDKKFGERLFKLGMWQIIALMGGMLVVTLIFG
jgi:hypothetical protein